MIKYKTLGAPACQRTGYPKPRWVRVPRPAFLFIIGDLLVNAKVKQ